MISKKCKLKKLQEVDRAKLFQLNSLFVTNLQAFINRFFFII